MTEEGFKIWAVFLPAKMQDKGEKSSHFNTFGGFGARVLDPLRLSPYSSKALSPASSDLKKHTNKTPCKMRSALLFLMCLSFGYKSFAREQNFCTFGLNSGCLITYYNSV